MGLAVSHHHLPEISSSPSLENSMAFTQPKCETKFRLYKFLAMFNRSLNRFERKRITLSPLWRLIKWAKGFGPLGSTILLCCRRRRCCCCWCGRYLWWWWWCWWWLMSEFSYFCVSVSALRALLTHTHTHTHTPNCISGFYCCYFSTESSIDNFSINLIRNCVLHLDLFYTHKTFMCWQKITNNQICWRTATRHPPKLYVLEE